MTYVEKTLAPNETVLERARFNWTYSISPFFWFFFGLAPLLYAGIAHIFLNGIPGNAAVVLILCAVPAALGIGILIGHCVHLYATEIAVTSSRFVFKEGLVARRTKEVSLEKIEEVTLSQSVIGRLFGYGQLTLHGTGVGVIELPQLDDPLRLRRKVEGAKAVLQEERGEEGISMQLSDAVSDETAPLVAEPPSMMTEDGGAKDGLR